MVSIESNNEKKIKKVFHATTLNLFILKVLSSKIGTSNYRNE